MAEPIEIIIRKGQGGSGTGFGLSGMQPEGRNTKFGTEFDALKAKDASDSKRLNAMVAAFALAQTKRAISYGISQYGNQTGNYIRQAEMQFGMQVFSTVSGIIGATVGAAIINPMLAVPTALIAVGSTGISLGMEARTLQTNITKLDTYANIMQERSGNTFNNGSRGTDY